MSKGKGIGRIKPKRIAVRIHPDGTREILDPSELEAEELRRLSMPKIPAPEGRGEDEARPPVETPSVDSGSEPTTEKPKRRFWGKA